MERNELHKRNKHNGQYDFTELISSYPVLNQFVAPNKYGTISIDFFNPQAVKALNKALLICYYGISFWDIPYNSLCPPIPGRADYIHYIAELIQSIHPNDKIKCLDIGVGANCIFPIIGVAEYNWQFVATDISMESISNVRKIVENNATLSTKVELRLQSDPKSIFRGIIRPDEFFDVTICNPPFHDSLMSAKRGTLRKLTNLKGRPVKNASLNFGGTDNELWCEGGELRFVIDMISESVEYRSSCGWFTTLVSKEDNLNVLFRKLKLVAVKDYKIIQMRQGNKNSRILAWRY